MDESILLTIKEMLGPSGDYEAFDAEIIMHINTAIMALTQMGVGPEEGFMIHDDSAIWSDFISESNELKLLQGVKSYIYFNVKLVFDPPASSSAVEAINRQLAQVEWRMFHEVDCLQRGDTNE